MQMVKKIFLIVLLTWFFILAFMPKAELYHTLEKTLDSQGIRLNEASIKEDIFSLKVKDITLYFKGIAVAHIDSLVFSSYLFYTTIEIENIEVDESLHKQAPAKTDKLRVIHTALSPFIVNIDGNGSFGTVEGNYHILDKKLAIDLLESKDISMFKAFLTKSDKGWSYEKSF